MRDIIFKHFMPVSTTLGIGIVFLLLRALTLRWLHHLFRRNAISRTIWEVLRLPSLFWCLAAAVHIGIGLTEFSERWVHQLQLVIQVVVVISITVAASTIFRTALTLALENIDSPLSRNGLLRGVISGMTYLIGFMIVLAKMGVRIEPLLTAFGVGGLAVSLALQDTLGNAFAGVNLLIERSFQVGDRIKIEFGGLEGVIEDIGWRTTRIRLDNLDLIVMPNIKLAQGVTVKRTQAGREMMGPPLASNTEPSSKAS